MGNFYTNIVLKGASRESVKVSLARMKRTAIVASANSDVTVVYDAEADGQDQDILRGLASALSKELECVAWAVLNHDDDILWYSLYVAGTLQDEYDSTPGYFDPKAEPSAPSGGDATKLGNAFGCPHAVPAIEAALRKSCFEDDGYVFALERHTDLAAALGLSINLLALGFNYIEGGDTPGVSPDSFVRIGS